MELTDDQKRWLVAVLALDEVVISSTRPRVKKEVENVYENLKKTKKIDTQTYSSRCTSFPSRVGGPEFKYENINGNDSVKEGEKLDRPKFNYKIQKAVDLGRLCLQPYMVKFTEFDEKCDGSAVLSLLGCVPSFSPAIQAAATTVRTRVRNKCAHVNFSEWNETHFHNCFRDMELLLCAMGLNAAEIDLKVWENEGVEKLCMTSSDNLMLELERITSLSKEELDTIKHTLSGFNENLIQLKEGQASMRGVLETVATKEQVARLQEKVDDLTSALESKTEMDEERRRNIIKTFKEHLMQHYTVGEETIIDPLPWMETAEFTLDKMYTEIRILETEPNQPNKPVAMHDIFWCSDEVQRPRNVLIQGNPGIGKSTFCRKLVYDWAKGNIPESMKFPSFEMLLKLKCCEMEDGSIWEAFHKQLVPEEFDEEERGVLFEYIKSNQEKICLIFDGYDEIPETETGHQILTDMKKVISKKYLPLCSLLLTSRQDKAQGIVKHFQRFFEIKGFNRSDAEKYIRKFYNSESVLTNELISFIRFNRFAAELVSNPLNTALLCIVFKENKERIIHKKGFTISELYEEIVRCVTKRYCSKANLEVDDDTFMDEFRVRHLALGKMALDGFQQDQVRFTVKQMPEEGLHKLGFLVREKSLSVLKPEKKYSFPHKSIQEYFAALYLAERLKKGESSDLFALTNATFLATNRYDVSGMVGKANASKAVESITSRLAQEGTCTPHVLVLLLELLSESQGEEGYQQTLDGVYSQMPAEARIVLPRFVLPSRTKALAGLCCLLRRTDPVHADDSQPIVPQPSIHLRSLELHGLDMNDVNLHFGDAMATNTSVDQLIINKSVFCDQDVHAFAKIIRRNKTLTSFRLNLGYCNEEATLDILNSLLENPTLRYFLIAGDNIGDRCGIALAKVLDKDILTSLIIISDKIGTSGAVAIAKGLANNTSLQELRLEHFSCHLSLAAPDLANALLQNKTLRQLFLSGCNIDDSAAEKIAEGISKNTSLSEIGITNSFLFRVKSMCAVAEVASSSNPKEGVIVSSNSIEKDGTIGHMENKKRFGDGGACRLATAVSSAKSIVKLNLSLNAINNKGAIAIGRILTPHCVLEVLDISANCIGDAGAKVIAEGIKGNSSLKELKIVQNAISWKGISYVAEALTVNNSLMLLDVSRNNIGGDSENRGAKAIKTILTKNTALQKLGVRGVNFGDSEASVIAEGLKQNKGIQIFDISGNNIGDTVMCDIADAAIACSTLEALKIVGINLGEKSAQAIVRACKTSKTMKEISHNCEAIRKRCGIEEVFVAADIEHVKYLTESHVSEAGMVKSKQTAMFSIILTTL